MPGTHREAPREPGCGALATRRDFRALGPRTHQAHLAAQHVQRLRQLVDAQAPQHVADRCRAPVRMRRPHGAGGRLPSSPAWCGTSPVRRGGRPGPGGAGDRARGRRRRALPPAARQSRARARAARGAPPRTHSAARSNGRLYAVPLPGVRSGPVGDGLVPSRLQGRAWPKDGRPQGSPLQDPVSNSRTALGPACRGRACPIPFAGMCVAEGRATARVAPTDP